jgi:hypothetical protein
MGQTHCISKDGIVMRSYNREHPSIPANIRAEYRIAPPRCLLPD